MEISRAATGLLAAICVTAGAGGTYLMVRDNGRTASSVEAAAAPTGVEQSEGVVPAEAPDPVDALAPVTAAPKPATPTRVTKPAPAPRPRAKTQAAAPAAVPAAPAREESLATIPAPSIAETQPARPIEPPAPVLEEFVGLSMIDSSREIDRMARSILALPSRIGSKLDVIERAVLHHAVEITGGNKSAAARLLGVHRKFLERRLDRQAEPGEIEDQTPEEKAILEKLQSEKPPVQ